jgi:hypothetical protein
LVAVWAVKLVEQQRGEMQKPTSSLIRSGVIITKMMSL